MYRAPPALNPFLVHISEVYDVTLTDCLHLQLYRDPKDRFKKGKTKASLSLQHFLGFESGFTLDKESNTIAIICQDVAVVLALETREQLIAWQVRVSGQLGASREYLVLVGSGGSRNLPAGPAKLHLKGKKFALTSGVPPRLLGLWEIAHLRRYGVVEGRFCFEGGSLCGKGSGLHVLLTDRPQDLADAFSSELSGTPRDRSTGTEKRNTRPDTRLSDFYSFDQTDAGSGMYEGNTCSENCGRNSPYSLSDDRQLYDDRENQYNFGIESTKNSLWNEKDQITLERCDNCRIKLDSISRSSTIVVNPDSIFKPAWTMESVTENYSDSSSNGSDYLTQRNVTSITEPCECNRPPKRPPKPLSSNQEDSYSFSCATTIPNCDCKLSQGHTCKVGPYENYDVPKLTHAEIHENSSLYDTPKKIKEIVRDELFKVTKSDDTNSLVLKKNCGCILKFGRRTKPVIVESDENLQPVECPCQKVTNWANNFIYIPYCKKGSNCEKGNTQIPSTLNSTKSAVYATVDVARKTPRIKHTLTETNYKNYQNLDCQQQNVSDTAYTNYENLQFALSLEFYENAKDLLKKAGVTQIELDALGANVDLSTKTLPNAKRLCSRCSQCQSTSHVSQLQSNKSDEYLIMEPNKELTNDISNQIDLNTGYIPMTPTKNWFQSLSHPTHNLQRVDMEKSLSILTLHANNAFEKTKSIDTSNKEFLKKRSSSADSSTILEHLKESDISTSTQATSSSLEKLQNLSSESRTPLYDYKREYCDQHCIGSLKLANKTSEESYSKKDLHLRNKVIDNACTLQKISNISFKSSGNRDSSSSNDSGVSSCSLKQGAILLHDFEMPFNLKKSTYFDVVSNNVRSDLNECLNLSLPRKSKSSDPIRELSIHLHKTKVAAKSSSAEAEVPVVPPRQYRGVIDSHSTSSGTSDMSDYIETLSLTSQSSADSPLTGISRHRHRQPTSTLRPRSGNEYQSVRLQDRGRDPLH